jgi:hypothetical protein
MKRFATTLLVCVAMLGGSARATTILAIRTPTGVTLGADSKLFTPDHSVNFLACKIGVANGVVFAQSGILEILDRNYRAAEFASTALWGLGNIADRVASFEQAITPRLTAIVEEIRTSLPDLFHRLYENGPALESIFAGVEKGVRVFHQRAFVAKAEMPLSLEIRRSSCPGDSCRGFAVLGHGDALMAEWLRRPKLMQEVGVEATIRHLIETQASAVPVDVGGPISIVEVTGSGIHWLSKGKCDG